MRQACASCVGNTPGAAALVLNPDLSQGLLFLSPWSAAGGAGGFLRITPIAALFTVVLWESVYRPESVSVINKGEAAHFQADDTVPLSFQSNPVS